MPTSAGIPSNGEPKAEAPVLNSPQYSCRSRKPHLCLLGPSCILIPTIGRSKKLTVNSYEKILTALANCPGKEEEAA
eukprot:4806532-Amphidinium_carterae.1